MKFSVKGFLSKCDQIRSFLRIWSHLPKKSLTENFILWEVRGVIRTLSNIYDGGFFTNIVNGQNLLTIFTKMLHCRSLVGSQMYL